MFRATATVTYSPTSGADATRQATCAGDTEYGGDDCAAAFKGYALPLSLGQTSDGWIGEQAATWVRQQAGAPFFLMTSFPGPHAPHAVPSDYADLYDPASIELPPAPPAGLADEGAYARYEGLAREELRVVIANYMACVTAVDACHSRVIQALKDEEITIYGDGSQTRSFCYCDDLVDEGDAGLHLATQTEVSEVEGKFCVNPDTDSSVGLARSVGFDELIELVEARRRGITGSEC